MFRVRATVFSGPHRFAAAATKIFRGLMQLASRIPILAQRDVSLGTLDDLF